MKKNLIPFFRLKLMCLFQLLFALSLAAFGNSESGEIRGTIRDQTDRQTLPGAIVSWYVDGTLQGTAADQAGEYKIKPLNPGYYELVFSYTGYRRVIKQKVLVTSGSTTFLDVELQQDNTLPEVEISVYQEPLIRRDFTGGVTRILQEDIKTGIARDIKDFVAQTASVYQKEEGGSVNIRGSRSNATQYYIDGIKMTGGFSIPKNSIQEITVITGGVPAQYGDATGGIVVITTKSAFNH